MCQFTCQTCRTTINQRETTTHVCEPGKPYGIRESTFDLLHELFDAERRAGATAERLALIRDRIEHVAKEAR